MPPKQFVKPFAGNGDKAPIPDAVQPSGLVSYDQGFGPDYSRQLGADPQAKSIERVAHNQLLFDITENLRAWQLNTFTEWASVNSYPLGAFVRDAAGVVYRSLKPNNSSLLNVATDWEVQNTQATILQAIADAVAKCVPRDSATGAGTLPAGTTAQRPQTPVVGMARRNTTLSMFEGWTGTAWEPLGGGATGGNGDRVIYLNDQIVKNDYTIPSGQNGGTFGPVSIADGKTLNLSDGSTYTVV